MKHLYASQALIKKFKKYSTELTVNIMYCDI